ETQVEYSFTVGNDNEGNPLATSDTIAFQISMGKIGDNTPISTIEIDNVSVVKGSGTVETSETISEASVGLDDSDDETTTPPADNSDDNASDDSGKAAEVQEDQNTENPDEISDDTSDDEETDPEEKETSDSQNDSGDAETPDDQNDSGSQNKSGIAEDGEVEP
ncbi:MAG: hypothetical protein HDR06_20000, partial [Lachnospiraceae bacterium]|nr:hypothetical protein [Lachnospiraceae bacterium]